MDAGIVYVVFNKWICNPETNEMPYKIGFTMKSVEERYYGLGLKMPGEFETLFAYKFDNCKEAENLLHDILDKKRVRGEWFSIDQNELDIVKSNCEKMGGVLVTDEIGSEILIETETDDISIEVLLKKIGMKTFVEYYNELKNVSSQEVKQCMELRDNFTNHSRDTKVSTGKKIFRENLNIQALEIISKSNRVDEKTKKDALKLLEFILNNVYDD